MTVWFFRPANDDCHNAKFDVEIKDGAAIVTLKEISDYSGPIRFSGKIGKDVGINWQVGGERCRINLQVYPMSR